MGDYTAKLLDFGCACPRYQLQTQCVGTMPFIAPECLIGNATDGAAADVWSLGVVVLEMRYGLRSLTRAMGWEQMMPSKDECGNQLSTIFADPAQGMTRIRQSLRITDEPQADVDASLIGMLNADATLRVAARA